MNLWERLTGSRPRRITFVLLVGGAVTTALLLFLLIYSVELSGLAAGAWISVLAFGLWAALDWSIKEIHTIEALQHRYVETEEGTREYPPNIAWALVLAGFLIMLGLTMLAGHS
jgi:hypothetical protein